MVPLIERVVFIVIELCFIFIFSNLEPFTFEKIGNNDRISLIVGLKVLKVTPLHPKTVSVKKWFLTTT